MRTIFSCKNRWTTIILPLVCIFLLSSCFATTTYQGPPPMDKRAGVAPKAAMLPIHNTNDKAIADYVASDLAKCLQERNVFDFVSQETVLKAVREGKYDMGKTFGLSASEYKELADKLGVKYTIHGVVNVIKSLTLKGWRRDVDVYIYINEASTGEKVDSWRSMTEFSFGSTDTVINAKKMAKSAANHTCAKMIKRSY